MKVKVSKPACEGKANKALISLISSYFNIKKSKIKIISGERSPLKTLDIDIDEQIFNTKLEKVVKNANL